MKLRALLDALLHLLRGNVRRDPRIRLAAFYEAVAASLRCDVAEDLSGYVRALERALVQFERSLAAGDDFAKYGVADLDALLTTIRNTVPHRPQEAKALLARGHAVRQAIVGGRRP